MIAFSWCMSSPCVALVGDFRHDAPSPTTEHAYLRKLQPLHHTSHYPISLVMLDLVRRACCVVLVLIFFLPCLVGASSTQASAPENKKINRRQDSQPNHPSQFPAPLIISSRIPAVSGCASTIPLEVTVAVSCLPFPRLFWFSAHQQQHHGPTRDLPTLSCVVSTKFYTTRAIYSVSISAELDCL